MPSSFSRLLFHCVFATHARRERIHDGIARRLYPYMASILPEQKGVVRKLGGTKDHVHLLLELPTDVPVAEAVRLIKANSSRWLNRSGLASEPFRWQRGFAAFTVSHSAAENVIRYIARQQAHHRRGGFDEELAALLRRHGLEPPGRTD